MKIRTLIVDDEPLAREKLRRFLTMEPDIELVGECESGSQAVTAIQTLTPDLVFLDVHIPEFDGFKVLEKLVIDPLPVIVFVTAHDQFALKAFEVHALDYLLKPFDRERLQLALSRVKIRLEQRQTSQLGQQLAALVTDLNTPKAQRLAVKTGGRILFVNFDDIDWMESADNYVEIHLGKESILHRQTLNEMEQAIDSKKFLRISRTTIVNISRVKELEPLFHGEYSVRLRDGTRLTLTRSYRSKVQQLTAQS